MSLTPAFEPGLSNVWLLMVPFVILVFGVSYAVIDRKSNIFISPDYTPQEKQYLAPALVLFYANVLYSIVVPLGTGAWLVVGLLVYGVGMGFVANGIGIFASTDVDQPNIRGLYRVSRNPMYFGYLLVHLGGGIAGASWVMIVIALVVFVLEDRHAVPPEERMCLEKYGDTYKDYMARVPRWIGVPRSAPRTEE